MSPYCSRLVVLALWGWFVLLPHAAAAESFFEIETTRDGWHVQVAFGWGAGPTSNGLLHNMELGRTFGDRGWTVGYDHIWVISDSDSSSARLSDLFGGHMLLLKVPLWLPTIVGKLALGIGENVNMSEGFKPFFGVGWLYGLDVHIPLFDTSGLSFGVVGFHAVTADVGHQWAAGSVVGYTWF